MAEPSLKKRVWGWFFFDWATQPYHTVLLTFVFGPYIVSVATESFMNAGLDEMASDARAQSLWSFCLTAIGLIIGFGGPIMGALADTAGRRMPWILLFSVLYVFGSAAIWWTQPDGSNLLFALIAFGVGFVGAEFALIFTNAQLPGLGRPEDIGKISGSGFAFGYLGGLVSLALVLVLFVEQSSGRTIVGLAPAFGLDPALREGTRFAGPFTALWFAAFMIPYFLWVRETSSVRRRHSLTAALAHLAASVRGLKRRPSTASFLGSSMLYRDALNGLYGFGGTYALLVLDWEITQVGVFGIVSVIAAAGFAWVGGRLDRRFGPKPVITAMSLGLMMVCLTVASISRESIYGLSVPEGSALPDRLFLVCGILIGGFGGILQSASRSMMVRHTDAETATESFGLYGLSGRATSFLAPALIGYVTLLTGNARFGVLPLIILFILSLGLLRWTHPDGDRARQWSKSLS